MGCCTGNSASRVAHFQRNASSPSADTARNCETLLGRLYHSTGLSDGDKMDEARRIYAESNKAGHRLRTIALNTLIRMIAKGGAEPVVALMKELGEDGFEPDENTYGILINRLGKRKALDILSELAKETKRRDEIQHEEAQAAVGESESSATQNEETMASTDSPTAEASSVSVNVVESRGSAKSKTVKRKEPCDYLRRYSSHKKRIQGENDGGPRIVITELIKLGQSTDLLTRESGYGKDHGRLIYSISLPESDAKFLERSMIQKFRACRTARTIEYLEVEKLKRRLELPSETSYEDVSKVLWLECMSFLPNLYPEHVGNYGYQHILKPKNNVTTLWQDLCAQFTQEWDSEVEMEEVMQPLTEADMCSIRKLYDSVRANSSEVPTVHQKQVVIAEREHTKQTDIHLEEERTEQKRLKLEEAEFE